MNEMKGEEGKNMRSKGITLIALVITIIVLLILAGISIAMLTGDNGILKQATHAKGQTERASDVEKIQLAVITASIKNNGYTEILDEASFRQELTNEFGNNEYDLVLFFNLYFREACPKGENFLLREKVE